MPLTSDFGDAFKSWRCGLAKNVALKKAKKCPPHILRIASNDISNNFVNHDSTTKMVGALTLEILTHTDEDHSRPQKSAPASSGARARMI